MFFRRKRAGSHEYLQLVENRREDGRPRQRVLCSLGRLDKLKESGELDRLLASGGRLSEQVAILSGDAQVEQVAAERVGTAMIFERLWRELGLKKLIKGLLAERRYEFDVERAVFMTVLHRLVAPGSDRACMRWRADYRLPGTESLSLHHLYRAMAWLGEPLAPPEPEDGLFDFRCTKDLIEETLFEQRRDLFAELELVFFDTTTLYFEGRGGQTLGRRGHSKDRRGDKAQMVVGAVVDRNGRPLCCEMWPGNTTDVKALLPVVDRLRERFKVQRVCVIADRGMFSRDVLAGLEERGIDYVAGARLRSWKEVRDTVLSRAGRYKIVHGSRSKSADPSPLKVKNVMVDDRRYVVCVNKDQARKDAADRESILATLRERVGSNPKAFVSNKGYRRYIKASQGTFAIDEAKVKADARYDGKWVLRTSLDISATRVALRYRDLWRVEQLFRTTKSTLDTRPIYHHADETIRGHVFCSFLALVLAHELRSRLGEAEVDFEWAQVLQDLDAVQLITVDSDGKRFELRTTARGLAGKVFRAVGVALPQAFRRLDHPPDPPASSTHLEARL